MKQCLLSSYPVNILIYKVHISLLLIITNNCVKLDLVKLYLVEFNFKNTFPGKVIIYQFNC